MPPPKKLDLMPPEFRDWLQQELAARGFGDIVDVTEALNFRLEEAGQELRIGKTAVGEFSKALKDQREAFSMAETLLSDMDIEQEGEIHKLLVQMIATSAVQMMRSVREEDGHLEAKELMALGRMLKDLMSSSGLREQLLEGERQRERDQRDRELAEKLETAEAQGGINKAAAQAAREVLGFA